MPASLSICRMTSTRAGCSTCPANTCPCAAAAANTSCGSPASGAARPAAAPAPAAVAASARALLLLLPAAGVLELQGDLQPSFAVLPARLARREACRCPSKEALGGAMLAAVQTRRTLLQMRLRHAGCPQQLARRPRPPPRNASLNGRRKHTEMPGGRAGRQAHYCTC